MVILTNNKLQRWSLKDFQQEAVADLPFEGKATQLAMGAGSNGPLLVHVRLEKQFPRPKLRPRINGGKDKDGEGPPPRQFISKFNWWGFVDLQTLKPFATEKGPPELQEFGNCMRISKVSTDGRAFRIADSRNRWPRTLVLAKGGLYDPSLHSNPWRQYGQLLLLALA